MFEKGSSHPYLKIYSNKTEQYCCRKQSHNEADTIRVYGRRLLSADLKITDQRHMIG